MKTLGRLIVILFMIVNYYNACSAGYKLMIESQDELNNLVIKDVKSGVELKISPWNSGRKSFLFICADLSLNHLFTNKNSVFRIFRLDNHKATKWFELPTNTSISFQDCFIQFPDNDSKQKINNGYDFVISNFLSNPVISESIKIRGRHDSSYYKAEHLEFSRLEDVSITWKKINSPVNLELIAGNKYDIICEVKNYPDSSFSYMQIPKSKLSELKENNEYILMITQFNRDLKSIQKKEVHFFYKRHFFLTPNPAWFITADSVSISWEPDYQIDSIYLENIYNNKVLWKNQKYSGNYLIYSNLKNSKIEFIPGLTYRLYIKTKKEEDLLYQLDFKILLTKSEFNTLHEFIHQ